MDAQATMRLMFDTMDAYDRGDFDRLGEIYAKDARWTNADPEGPHCRDRDDIFAMFRQPPAQEVRRQGRLRRAALDADPGDPDRPARRLRPCRQRVPLRGPPNASIADYPSMEAAQSAMAQG
jgi:hypothetical protein